MFIDNSSTLFILIPGTKQFDGGFMIAVLIKQPKFNKGIVQKGLHALCRHPLRLNFLHFLTMTQMHVY